MSDLLLKDKWDASYGAGQNFIFYPKEELVKFLNRHVRKRVSPSQFRDINFELSLKPCALDFGCGVGRQTQLLNEFGFRAFGYDISSQAVEYAKSFAAQNLSAEDSAGLQFGVLSGTDLPHADEFFDFTLCDSVLDSMSWGLASKVIKELSRVTRRIGFLTFMSGHYSEFGQDYAGEQTVTTEHESGTVQAFFNPQKIRELLSSTSFEVFDLRLVVEENILTGSKMGRYFVGVKKGVK